MRRSYPTGNLNWYIVDAKVPVSIRLAMTEGRRSILGSGSWMVQNRSRLSCSSVSVCLSNDTVVRRTLLPKTIGDVSLTNTNLRMKREYHKWFATLFS